jgi:hypothetical protein
MKDEDRWNMPRWAELCVARDHSVTLDEKEGGQFELFCSDCSRGESVPRWAWAHVYQAVSDIVEEQDEG